MEKIEKLEVEIKATKSKIEGLQKRLANLEHRKKTIEDMEILSMVKSVSCRPQEVKAIVAAIKDNNVQYLVEFMKKNESISL